MNRSYDIRLKLMLRLIEFEFVFIIFRPLWNYRNEVEADSSRHYSVLVALSGVRSARNIAPFVIVVWLVLIIIVPGLAIV